MGAALDDACWVMAQICPHLEVKSGRDLTSNSDAGSVGQVPPARQDLCDWACVCRDRSK